MAYTYHELNILAAEHKDVIGIDFNRQIRAHAR